MAETTDDCVGLPSSDDEVVDQNLRHWKIQKNYSHCIVVAIAEMIDQKTSLIEIGGYWSVHVSEVEKANVATSAGTRSESGSSFGSNRDQTQTETAVVVCHKGFLAV